jgi:hypothetical protein
MERASQRLLAFPVQRATPGSWHQREEANRAGGVPGCARSDEVSSIEGDDLLLIIACCGIQQVYPLQGDEQLLQHAAAFAGGRSGFLIEILYRTTNHRPDHRLVPSLLDGMRQVNTV